MAIVKTYICDACGKADIPKEDISSHKIDDSQVDLCVQCSEVLDQMKARGRKLPKKRTEPVPVPQPISVPGVLIGGGVIPQPRPDPFRRPLGYPPWVGKMPDGGSYAVKGITTVTCTSKGHTGDITWNS